MKELIERLKYERDRLYTLWCSGDRRQVEKHVRGEAITDVINEAMAALKSLPVWVECSERAPEDERDVVICNMNCTNTYSYPYEPSESLRLAFGGGLAGWHDAETGEVIPADELTHWIDVGLPAPPKVEQGE